MVIGDKQVKIVHAVFGRDPQASKNPKGDLYYRHNIKFIAEGYTISDDRVSGTGDLIDFIVLIRI
jgi:hypothetical protein